MSGRLLHRHASAIEVGAVEAPTISEELDMQAITTIGLDIAKSVFQVHGVDVTGQGGGASSVDAATFWRSSRSYRRALVLLRSSPLSPSSPPALAA